jgi:hypothetical protein
MTTATSTATVLTALQSAGLVLTLTPDRGLGVTPKARLTEPLRVLIKAHREDLVRWLGRSASNDPTARVDMGIPTSPPAPASTDWQALDKAYQAHHVNCPTCIAAGKGYGLRCGVGAALWAAYDAVDMPVHGKVSARAVGKVSPRVRTEAHTVDPLLTDTGNPASAARTVDPLATDADKSHITARMALFDARGLSAGDSAALINLLMVRDREGDRRGACAECHQLVGYGPGRWKCGDRQHGINDLAGANLGAAFVHVTLHHCQSFKGATP